MPPAQGALPSSAARLATTRAREGEGEGDVAAAAAAAVDCFGRGWRDGFLASAGTVHAEGATERRLSSGLAAAHSSHTIPA